MDVITLHLKFLININKMTFKQHLTIIEVHFDFKQLRVILKVFWGQIYSSMVKIQIQGEGDSEKKHSLKNKRHCTISTKNPLPFSLSSILHFHILYAKQQYKNQDPSQLPPGPLLTQMTTAHRKKQDAIREKHNKKNHTLVAQASDLFFPLLFVVAVCTKNDQAYAPVQ